MSEFRHTLRSKEPELPISFAAVFDDPVLGGLQTVPPIFMGSYTTSLRHDYRQKKTYVKTLGGHIEFNWGDELDSISAAAVSVSFMDGFGMTSSNREASAGYEDFRALLELYKTNGDVRDELGRVVSEGRIILLHDVGRYRGYFEDFNYVESEDKPWNFTLGFTFKVEKTDIIFAPSDTSSAGFSNFTPPPNFNSWQDVKNLPKVQFDRLMANLETEFTSKGIRTKPPTGPGLLKQLDPGRVSFNKDLIFQQAQEKRDQRNASRRERSSQTAQLVFDDTKLKTFGRSSKDET